MDQRAERIRANPTLIRTCPLANLSTQMFRLSTYQVCGQITHHRARSCPPLSRYSRAVRHIPVSPRRRPTNLFVRRHRMTNPPAPRVQYFKPVLTDLLMGRCEWVSGSRESARLANACELRVRITDVLYPHLVGSACGMAIRRISRRLVNHCRIRANPLGLRIHANRESASQLQPAGGGFLHAAHGSCKAVSGGWIAEGL